MRLRPIFFVLLVFTMKTLSGQDDRMLVTKDSTVVANPAVTKAVLKPERRWGDGGVGFGLDYGGLIGVKATFYPIPYMGVFAAGGWEVIGLGWNIGCLGRLIPADGKHGARPYLKVMYGVNAVTKVDGKSSYDKMFYGFTVGVGLETRFGRFKKTGLIST